MAQHHNLEKYCRVCGGRLQRAKSKAATYKCTEHTEELRALFQVDVLSDDPDVHPQLFCNGCYAAVRRHSTAVSKGIPYHHSIEVFTWEKPTDEECAVRTIQFRYIHFINLNKLYFQVCKHLDVITRGGGQNKRARKNRGRPSGYSPAAAIAHIKQLVKSLPHFVDSAEEVIYTSDQAATLLCPLCLEVLDQPIELACSNLVCANCCCKWIERSGTVSCPCCYYHQLDDLTISLPSTVVQDLLGTLKLSCTKCHKTTTAAQHRLHKNSQCQGHYEASSPSQITAQHILQRPMTAPTLPVEKQVAECLVRRLMTESDDTVVRIPTRGQVRNRQWVLYIEYTFLPFA